MEHFFCECHPDDIKFGLVSSSTVKMLTFGNMLTSHWMHSAILTTAIRPSYVYSTELLPGAPPHRVFIPSRAMFVLASLHFSWVIWHQNNVWLDVKRVLEWIVQCRQYPVSSTQFYLGWSWHCSLSRIWQSNFVLTFRSVVTRTIQRTFATSINPRVPVLIYVLPSTVSRLPMHVRVWFGPDSEIVVFVMLSDEKSWRRMGWVR